jgi:ribosome maturation factor RimP
MIDEKKIKELVLSRIEGSELFLVNITISASNDIRVSLDSMEGVMIQECVKISRSMTEELDLLEENYSLEVSSPGLGEPLMQMQQYQKNIGRDVEVVFVDGKKKKGKLLSVSEEGIVLEISEKKIAEGGSQKKKKTVLIEKEVKFDELKSTKVVISF